MEFVGNFAGGKDFVESNRAGVESEIVFGTAVEIDTQARKRSAVGESEWAVAVPKGRVWRQAEDAAQDAGTAGSGDAAIAGEKCLLVVAECVEEIENGEAARFVAVKTRWQKNAIRNRVSKNSAGNRVALCAAGSSVRTGEVKEAEESENVKEERVPSFRRGRQFLETIKGN